MPKAKPINSTTPPIEVTASEALFLGYILKCQGDYGVRKPDILGPLPTDIVVDYAYVQRSMLGHIRGASQADDALSVDLTRLALKAARQRLTEAGVIGLEFGWIWWTGRPVDGVTHGVRA